MIIANVEDQVLTLRYEGVVSDSVRFLKVKFNFNNTWDDKAKVAVFKYDSHEYMVIFTAGNSMYLGDNTCFVPQEVIKHPGFSVSAYGTKEQSVITTNEATVDVEESGYGDILPAEPTPTVWNQLLTACRIRQLPEGGLAGEVLQKASNSDDDVKWGTVDAYSRAEAALTFVPKTTTVNGKTLNHNISINCADVGAYPYPESGIPKYDLSASVKASLGKADSALQEHQDISGKQDKLTAGQNITIDPVTNVISATRNKKYELIETITIQGNDINTVYRDKEPNGQSYNFEIVKIFVENGGTGSTSKQFRVSLNGDEVVYVLEGSNPENNEYIYLDVSRGLLSGFYYNPKKYYLSSSIFYSLFLRNEMKYYDNISSLQFATQPSLSFEKNTKITIYGVRK